MQPQIKEAIKRVARKHGVHAYVVHQIYRSVFKRMNIAFRNLVDVRLIKIGFFSVRWYFLRKGSNLTTKFKNDDRYQEVRDRIGWEDPNNLS